MDANPLTFHDFYGLTKVSVDRDNGVMTIDPEAEGRAPYTRPITTGRPGCECNDSTANSGPIPRGAYFVNSGEIAELSSLEALKRNRPSFMGGGDWGSRNVAIHPYSPTQTHTRSGFYLHEGSFDGSAGCIDIGGGVFGDEGSKQVFDDIKADPDGVVPVTVY